MGVFQKKNRLRVDQRIYADDYEDIEVIIIIKRDTCVETRLKLTLYSINFLVNSKHQEMQYNLINFVRITIHFNKI